MLLCDLHFPFFTCRNHGAKESSSRVDQRCSLQKAADLPRRWVFHCQVTNVFQTVFERIIPKHTTSYAIIFSERHVSEHSNRCCSTPRPPWRESSHLPPLAHAVHEESSQWFTSRRGGRARPPTLGRSGSASISRQVEEVIHVENPDNYLRYAMRRA